MTFSTPADQFTHICCHIISKSAWHLQQSTLQWASSDGTPFSLLMSSGSAWIFMMVAGECGGPMRSCIWWLLHHWIQMVRRWFCHSLGWHFVWRYQCYRAACSTRNCDSSQIQKSDPLPLLWANNDKNFELTVITQDPIMASLSSSIMWRRELSKWIGKKGLCAQAATGDTLAACWCCRRGVDQNFTPWDLELDLEFSEFTQAHAYDHNSSVHAWSYFMEGSKDSVYQN